MKKFGYCALTADFLHIGHINFLKFAKDKCEKLFVGVMSDESVEKYKGQRPIMNVYERAEILKNLKMVRGVFIQDSFEFSHSVLRMKEFWGEDFIIFDSEEHKRDGADVLIPYTKGISSTRYKLENFNYSKLTI